MSDDDNDDNKKGETLADDLLIGAAAIADFIYGENSGKRRKVYGLAENKALPIFHIGRELCARRSELKARLVASEAAND